LIYFSDLSGRAQADGGVLEVLQLASQHQGDQAIDSLAGLTLNPESAPSHQSPQASAQLPANNADASGGIKAATAPGVVSAHLLMPLGSRAPVARHRSAYRV